jgi:hypothetical protein
MGFCKAHELSLTKKKATTQKEQALINLIHVQNELEDYRPRPREKFQHHWAYYVKYFVFPNPSSKS